MRNSQLLVGLVFAASLGFALGSCGSSSSTKGPSCLAGPTGSCTQAELDTYYGCISTQCASAIATCNGSSGPFASYSTCISKCSCTDTACRMACGQPTSACSTCEGTVTTCAFGSTCTVPACLVGGGTGGASGSVGGTSGGTGGHVGTGGSTGGLGGATGTTGTCADLLACCNAANAAVKPSCMNGYNTVMPMGDAACGQVLAGIKASVCP
jgi:hypothetical protein